MRIFQPCVQVLLRQCRPPRPAPPPAPVYSVPLDPPTIVINNIRVTVQTCACTSCATRV